MRRNSRKVPIGEPRRIFLSLWKLENPFKAKMF
jgi:hypothetical protein